MPRLVESPVLVPAAGEPPKVIEEFVGRPSTGSADVSVARMRSPAGWAEPGQRARFREITLVLAGRVHAEFEGGRLVAAAGQAIVAEPGEWVRFSTPDPGGADYVAICLPAFSPDLVRRDAD